MQRICVCVGQAARRSPRPVAVTPPMPVSTSSKISVPTSDVEGDDALERQHGARELAAGGRVAQRAQRHAGVGGEEELGLVGAARPERLPALAARRRATTCEAGVRHGERPQLCSCTAPAKAGAPGGALCAEARRRRQRLAPVAAASRRRSSPSSACERSSAASRSRASSTIRQHRVGRGAVLALERLQLVVAELDGVAVRRVGVELVKVRVQRQRRRLRPRRREHPDARRATPSEASSEAASASSAAAAAQPVQRRSPPSRRRAA